jgi:hypothetical protein
MPGAMVKAMLIGWFALAVGVGVRWFRRSSVVDRLAVERPPSCSWPCDEGSVGFC